MTIAFGVLGLLVGFLCGIALDDAIDYLRTSRKEIRMEALDKPARGDSWRTWLLVIALIANGGTAAVLIQARADTADFTRCTAQWQEDFFTAYSARTDANAETQDAIDRIVEAVNSPRQAGISAAVDNYVEVRKEQLAKRAANPLPPLPEEACGRER